MKKLLTGNASIAHGVVAAGAQVIAAYPITPQTSIVEKLVEFCADGTLNAEFVTVESEHSALACLVGAASTGVRVFTATSSQGLALMHEVLHWAVGARLPIVLANVNRAMAAPWTIWCDQGDSLAQRDTGWIQFYCETCQEAFDSILQAYKVAEALRLPAMVNIDGFYLSHTSAPVELPNFRVTERFLPYQKKKEGFIGEPGTASSFNGGTTPDFFYEFRVKTQQAMERVETELKGIFQEFHECFGRSYQTVDLFEVEDAEMVLVTMGSLSGTVRSIVRKLRKSGKKIGMVKIRLFNPFPYQLLRQFLLEKKKIAVIDRDLSPGRGGIVSQEVKTALYPVSPHPVIFSFIAGLGGRDIVPEDIGRIVEILERHPTPASELYWIGLKHEFIPE